MIKIEVNGTTNTVEHNGDPIRVAAELAACAGAIYSGLRITDQMSAEVFRLALVRTLMPESGVWNPQDGEVTTIIRPKDMHKKDGAPTDQS